MDMHHVNYAPTGNDILLKKDFFNSKI
jgi:hypothetical protein